MEILKAACHAMATRFEMVLHGENPVALRAAAEEAVHEIERLHAQLSLYSPSSEVSYINARAGHQAVQVEPRLFALLQEARRIHEETEGAFDITIAPLIRCWGFMRGSGILPAADQLEEARALVGMQHVILDERRCTVRFARPGMMIDLGSIGKGYALEVAVETLAEAGVQSALIHGGTSTVCAIGGPSESDGWKVAIEAPPPTVNSESGTTRPESPLTAPLGSRDSASVTEEKEAGHPLAVVTLKDESLSVSAVHGKCFRVGGKLYGHVIDPRTGVPAQTALLAAAILPSATETDALTTALLLGGIKRHAEINSLRPSMRSLVVEAEEATGRLLLSAKGIEVTPAAVLG